MTDLKTLKDIGDADDKEGCCTISDPYTAEDPYKIANYRGDEWKQIENLHVNVLELRAEAIKWIKAMENGDAPIDIDWETDEEEVIIRFIKHFFNITEDELK